MFLKISLMIVGLLIIDICHSKAADSVDSTDNSNHHRQKRLFWITHDGRIALPPGTILVITPTLELPFVRYPLEGFFSNLTMSLPFTIKFDTLGLTDNSNPFGTFPFSSIGGRNYHKREAEDAIAEDPITSFVKRRLLKRNIREQPPPNAFHGGERALLYGTAEDMLSTLGLDGKACLLRAICEVQSHPLINFGLVGEVLKLFFAASKSPFAGLLNDYVEAENRGKVHGECWPYFKNCPRSLFLPSANKYAKDSNMNDSDDNIDEEINVIPDDDDVHDHDIHHSREHMLNPIM